MTFISGILAALLSPFVTTIGFIIWEYTWSASSSSLPSSSSSSSSCANQHHVRSAFALNLYKCCLAAILFLLTIFCISSFTPPSNNNHDASGDDHAVRRRSLQQLLLRWIPPPPPASHPPSRANDHMDNVTLPLVLFPTAVAEEDHFVWNNRSKTSDRNVRSLTLLLWSIPKQNHQNDSSNATRLLHTRKQIIGYLTLSSTIGIIIGDILWLHALTILGTVRVVFIDALKPFCATVFGSIILHEPFRLVVLCGIACTVLGILCISLEQNNTTASCSTTSQHPQEVRQDNNDSNSLNIIDHDREGRATMTSTEAHDNTTVITADRDPLVVSASVASSMVTTNGVTTTSTAATLKNNGLVPTTTTQDMSSGLNGIPVLPPSQLWIGYVMSLMNVVLDTYGSVLTKEYGIHLSVWEINFIRFGFAGAVLLLVSIGMMITYGTLVHKDAMTTHRNDVSTTTAGHITTATCNENMETIPPSSHGVDVNDDTTAATNPIPVSAPMSPVVSLRTAETKEPMSDSMNIATTPWYTLPVSDPDMTKWVWLYVSIGVVLVTYIAPTLSNYALFEIPLALSLTLTSVGPLYALPLSYCTSRYMKWYFDSSISPNNPIEPPSPPVQRPPMTLRAGMGAALTVAGIVVLAYTGDSTM
jgi:drug/metabolite transporter (DMT)-like permease